MGQHDFIKNAKSPDILAEMIAEAQQIREHLQETTETSMVDDSSQTMVPGDEGTLARYPTLSKGDTEESDGGGTMIIMSTLEGENKKTTSNVKSDDDATSEISSNLGTMVINDNEDGDDDTMVTRNVQEKAQEILNKRLLEQISGGQIQDGPSLAGQGYSSTSPGNNNTSPSMGGGGDNNQTKFQRCIAEGDLDFVSIAQ